MALSREESGCNEWQYFEALDRAFIVQQHLENALGEHPAIKNHPELMSLYKQANENLGELYSLIGQFSFNKV